MDRIKVALLTAALLGASAVPMTAGAHGGGRASFGVFVGVPAPVFYPRYHYYPRYYSHPGFYSHPGYYYAPPAVLVPAPVSPPVYIEQAQAGAPPAAAPAQPSAAYWYFCRDTQTYYPYVQQCATPWEQVLPSNAPRS